MPHNHLEQEARQYIDETEVYIAVPQEEIIGAADPSNIAATSGGGLIAVLIEAMVDNHRAKKAEKAATPIKDKLIDYDYAQILAEEINSKLKAITWLKAKDIELGRSVEDKWVEKKVEATSSSAILIMHGSYRISPNVNSIDTLVNIILFPNSLALEKYKEKKDHNKDKIDQSDNIYRNQIEVSTQLFSSTKKNENMVEIEKLSADKFKAALDKNAKEISQKIYDDLYIDGKTDKAK